MRRIQFDKCGNPEEVLYLAEIADPEPGPGEVVLQITLRPVNPADIAYIRGLYISPEVYPATTGMEAVGVVTGVGSNVTGITAGGRYMVGRSRGTWAERMTVPAGSVVPVPADIPDETACQMHANPLTAWLLLQGLTKAGAVVQTAAGSAVGRLVQQLGKIQGRKIINIVRDRTTADDLKQHGTDLVVLSSDPDWPAQVRQAAGEAPIIAAFDPVAGPGSQDLLNVLSPGGELILYGSLSGQPLTVGAMQLAAKNLSVKGFWLAPWYTNTTAGERDRVINGLLALFQNRQLEIPVADIFDFHDFISAIHASLRPGRLGKILLRS